jgi:hypothetical protein
MANNSRCKANVWEVGKHYLSNSKGIAQDQDEKKQILLINEKPKKRWSLFRRK